MPNQPQAGAHSWRTSPVELANLADEEDEEREVYHDASDDDHPEDDNETYHDAEDKSEDAVAIQSEEQPEKPKAEMPPVSEKDAVAFLQSILPLDSNGCLLGGLFANPLPVSQAAATTSTDGVVADSVVCEAGESMPPTWQATSIALPDAVKPDTQAAGGAGALCIDGLPVSEATPAVILHGAFGVTHVVHSAPAVMGTPFICSRSPIAPQSVLIERQAGVSAVEKGNAQVPESVARVFPRGPMARLHATGCASAVQMRSATNNVDAANRLGFTNVDAIEVPMDVDPTEGVAKTVPVNIRVRRPVVRITNNTQKQPISLSHREPEPMEVDVEEYFPVDIARFNRMNVNVARAYTQDVDVVMKVDRHTVLPAHMRQRGSSNIRGGSPGAATKAKYAATLSLLDSHLSDSAQVLRRLQHIHPEVPRPIVQPEYPHYYNISAIVPMDVDSGPGNQDTNILDCHHFHHTPDVVPMDVDSDNQAMGNLHCPRPALPENLEWWEWRSKLRRHVKQTSKDRNRHRFASRKARPKRRITRPFGLYPDLLNEETELAEAGTDPLITVRVIEFIEPATQVNPVGIAVGDDMDWTYPEKRRPRRGIKDTSQDSSRKRIAARKARPKRRPVRSFDLYSYQLEESDLGEVSPAVATEVTIVRETEEDAPCCFRTEIIAQAPPVTEFMTSHAIRMRTSAIKRVELPTVDDSCGPHMLMALSQHKQLKHSFAKYNRLSAPPPRPRGAEVVAATATVRSGISFLLSGLSSFIFLR
ncbi:hypothetical protein GALMADRAFT_1041667 [Galerina marginata CBS 339.88]|uniref:Uncharacterized protein n=1 Tax=Galerina marginata (strain CBS 339.88) TaxID=685588 RepID=A0A067SEG2_GALM3|nr:hypothetical protein GALMADRAFT_1041667 [Galerina marginata CBS 339.88]